MLKPKSNASNSRRSRFEKFQIVEVKRSDLKNTPYNPRVINKHARKKLKDKIEKRGLVMPLVWNKRTGHLVGGNQRLSILDDLERGDDYTLSVAQVDVDEKTEKELVIFLNNESAMGTWDIDTLGKLLREEVSPLDAGFDALELDLLGLENSDSLFSSKKDNAADTLHEIQKMKDARKKYRAQQSEANDAEFYVVVVFQGRSETDSFLKMCRLPLTERYVNGKYIASLIAESQKIPISL